MNRAIAAIALPLLVGACAASQHASSSAHDISDQAETVLVTYRVQAGKEADLRALLDRAWATYRREHLVHPEPHVVVQASEADGKPTIVEIFTWVDRRIPEDAPQTVKTLWQQEDALCEKRGDRYSIEPQEVQLLVPAPRN